METLDPAVGRARAFGEDDDAVTLCDLLRERGSEAFVPVCGVVEAQIADDASEDRRTPYPAVGHHHRLGADAQQYEDVDERLVVGDHHRRFGERFARVVQAYGFGGDHRPQESPRHMVDRPLHDALLASSRHRQRPEREDQRLQQLASRHEQSECVEGVDEAAQRVGRAAFFGLRRDEHPEQHGLYGVGYQHHGDDAEERDQRQRMERRMPREDQRSESHDDREG